MNDKNLLIWLPLLVVLLTACERRELYVYGDEFHSVDLVVDWRDYSSTDPKGMTVWFYPVDDPTHEPYVSRTSNVRYQSLYLPGGRYDGVIIDYSPEEYTKQHFVGLDDRTTARVEAAPLEYQPAGQTVTGEAVPEGTSDAVNRQLFADAAWDARYTDRPALQSNGLYTVVCQPETMGLDTLQDRRVAHGQYGDYIPYEERDTYQSTISVDTIYAAPQSVIWKLRVRVYIASGFNSLWQTVGSISGLADGHYLVSNVNSNRPCLVMADNWETQRTGNNSGYIQTTLTTFGLRPEGILPGRILHSVQASASGDALPAGWSDYYTGVCAPDELRLNLSFVLRDHATVCHYHFSVGHCVVSYDRQRVLRVELGADWPEPIILPYVEAYDGTGFDADVEPWKDGGVIDKTM